MRSSRSAPRGRKRCLVLVLLLAGAATSPPSDAAEVRFFKVQSRAAFLSGTLDGIGVDSLGILQLAGRVDRIADVGEPFLFAAAPHPEGWVLGTGNAGRVLLLDRRGGLSSLLAAEEPEIFAVLADEDGTVYAGSSPGGKVYRIRDGVAEELFDPGETYIWALARAADGDLLVATGTEGKLFKVDAEGRGELFFDSEDTHLRALQVLPEGAVLVGTAGEGLILRLEPDGRARTLYDATYPEVVDFAVDGEGASYAAVLASEASLVPQAAPSGGGQEAEEGGDGSQGTVQVTVGSEASDQGLIGSRPEGFSGPRSEILRISPEGVVTSVARFEEDTVYSLVWSEGRLWVGTGLEGKLFSLQDGKPVMEKDVDERQVVILLAGSDGPVFATTNAAAFYRMSGETERRGTYTSATLDAEQVARFGSLRWNGRLPRGAGLRFSTRSGLSSSPDRTWTPWTEPAGGEEISLTGLAPGRFLQWRAEFTAAGGVSPALAEVVVSYRQRNLAPRVQSLEVMQPGEVLVPANFNPSTQIFEPVHPNRQGIFTTLQPSQLKEDRRLKTVWKRGYRTLRWEAEDPNEDPMVFELAFRVEREGSDWLVMEEELEESHLSFDSTVLPDGRYRFRLRVSDRRSDESERLVEEEVSEPVLVDHSPPHLEGIRRRTDSWLVEVFDGLSPLRSAEVSVDAGPWKQARAEDGLLDGRTETLVLEPTGPGRLVLLRLMDVAFNVTTFDISETKP